MSSRFTATKPRDGRWAFLLLFTSVSAVALPLGCSGPPPPVAVEQPRPADWFLDVTDQVGLDFVHDPGPTGSYFMPQSMGSGCAFLDFDGDGRLDIYLLHQGGPKGKKNQLFQQRPDGMFLDVSKNSGLDIVGLNTGVAVGDVNNDGRPDLVVTQYGGIRLFLNQGGGRFQDATDAAGLLNPVWGASAAFLDYDRDGWLDLVVVNYLDYDPKVGCKTPKGLPDFCGPSQFAGRSAKLFRNRGAAPARTDQWLGFEDVSFASGIGRLIGPGLGVVAGDFDGDGWQDIFVANDGKPNRLWINQKDGTFADEATSRGVAYTSMGAAYAGMGVAVGDADGNGQLDLFVTHLNLETHTLWRQGPRGQFKDHTAAAGLMTSAWRGTGFGALMADFNLDGAIDIAIANGRVYRGGPAKSPELGFWETYAERNQLFINDGNGRFSDASPANPAFCGAWNVARGLACADYDNDGAPDLLLTTIGGRARLYRNIAPDRGHWLKVRALDPVRKRDAYGAVVSVRAGDRTWVRQINPAESYLSSSAPHGLFGLGNATKVDAIQVTWPDGKRESFGGGAVDRAVELRQGEGRAP